MSEIKAGETGIGQKAGGWRKMVQDGSCKGFRVLKACFYAALYGRHKGRLAKF